MFSDPSVNAVPLKDITMHFPRSTGSFRLVCVHILIHGFHTARTYTTIFAHKSGMYFIIQYGFYPLLHIHAHKTVMPPVNISAGIIIRQFPSIWRTIPITICMYDFFRHYIRNI